VGTIGVTPTYDMIFNSLEFAIFLPVVFLLYWLVLGRKRKAQNGFLVIASYVFYGWWDWRFLFLIFASSLVDYVVGLCLGKVDDANHGKRKILLGTSLVVNLGLLGVFKYYNFFAESLAEAVTFFGHRPDVATLSWVLPVGISFYTFQTLSYSIDVYRRKMEPVRDPVAFFAYVSFFPQLVAGPIERASHLVPQFMRPRVFSYGQASDGMRQILWGLFKKMVIADNCAVLVNQIFASPESYPGSVLVLGAVLFAFQIYGDFSGYSDIAIGTARLFGFDIMRNFAYPYFSRDIAEFWRRWHISLSSWFKDYIYIPLGGSRVGPWKVFRNVAIIFLVSGFWHGANWTFIVWGGLHALFFIPLLLASKNRRHTHGIAEGRRFPSMREMSQMLSTFAMVCVAWVFFRADSLADALDYLWRAVTTLHHDLDVFSSYLSHEAFEPLIMIVVLLVVEWVQRHWQHGLDLSRVKRRFVRYVVYYVMILILYFYGGEQQDFIYFQF
jgi:alginate O-acetyltransferase complex protein AlgI